MNNNNQDQQKPEDIEDHKSAPSEKDDEEDDIIYLEDEEMEALDQDVDDFQTINESELGDPNQYDDGQILDQEII